MSTVYYSVGLKVPWLGRTFDEFGHNHPSPSVTLFSDPAVDVAHGSGNTVRPDGLIHRLQNEARELDETWSGDSDADEHMGADL